MLNLKTLYDILESHNIEGLSYGATKITVSSILTITVNNTNPLKETHFEIVFPIFPIAFKNKKNKYPRYERVTQMAEIASKFVTNEILSDNYLNATEIIKSIIKTAKTYQDYGSNDVHGGYKDDSNQEGSESGQVDVRVIGQ